jgi:hypothetical protein
MLAGKTTLMAAASGNEVTALSAQARTERVAAGQVEPGGIERLAATVVHAPGTAQAEQRVGPDRMWSLRSCAPYDLDLVWRAIAASG